MKPFSQECLGPQIPFSILHILESNATQVRQQIVIVSTTNWSILKVNKNKQITNWSILKVLDNNSDLGERLSTFTLPQTRLLRIDGTRFKWFSLISLVIAECKYMGIHLNYGSEVHPDLLCWILSQGEAEFTPFFDGRGLNLSSPSHDPYVSTELFTHLKILYKENMKYISIFT